MKKTLIALLALGSTAMATDTIIGNAGQNASLKQNGDILVVTGESLSSNMALGSGTTKTPNSTDYRNSFTYASGNIGNGDLSEATYTLNFTVERIADETAAHGMTIDFFSLSGVGKPQPDPNGYYVNVSLRLGGEDVAGGFYEGTVATTRGDNQQGASAYENGGITINTSKSSYRQLELPDVDWNVGNYTLTVVFSQAQDYKSGCFAGIGNVTLHSQSVPEPATGSLSLLALAGLCIRRRK